MLDRTLVITNPRSRNGATGRHWESVERKLRDVLGAIEVEHTRAPRDAERIAREGVRAGVERLVVAGGDGTVSEVVTGLLAAELGDYVEVGVLPLGSGGDFARTLGSSMDIDAAIGRLASGVRRKIDAGRVIYCVEGEAPSTRYFANVSSVGLSGVVAERVHRSAWKLGGRLSFLLGTLRALAGYRSESVSIRVDGNLLFEGPLAFAAVANGQYFGGGMRVAPSARLDDGQFDVVVIPHRSKLGLLTELPLLYSGSHIGDPRTIQTRGRNIEVGVPSGTAHLAPAISLEIDGEPLGGHSIGFELLPHAITLFGFDS